MPSTYLPDKSFGLGTLRLDTLIRLRWMAIVGQFAAVLGVHFLLGFPVPLGASLALISVSVLVNLVLRLRYPAIERVDPKRAAGFLGFDIVQLAALLFLTGGLQNPFAFLFLAPVMISATTLPPLLTLALGLLAIGCATLLTTWHLPLPWFAGQVLAMPIPYIVGMWCSVVLGLAFIGVYAWRVAEEARLLSNALAATELVLAREQHLSQLDGLAAAAAHELGTPLATIALVAKELEVAAPPQGEFVDDVRLLRSQVERCREILGKLASLGDESHAQFTRLPLEVLTEEVAAPHRDFGIAITARFDGVERIAPTTARNAGMLYGLGNIVENAVDFAKSQVTIVAAWDPKIVTITVSDDGSGFPPEIMARLGDPYITRRRPRVPGQPGGGLGLGFFIANTLLERSGASIALANRPAPDSGAIVRLEWPREIFER
jgi:two-component system sensor histidine kinase RegB